MQVTNTNGSAQIVKMGSSENPKIDLVEGMTVGQVFEEAGVSFVEGKIFCEGTEVKAEYGAQDGDIYTIHAEKVDAGK